MVKINCSLCTILSTMTDRIFPAKFCSTGGLWGWASLHVTVEHLALRLDISGERTYIEPYCNFQTRWMKAKMLVGYLAYFQHIFGVRLLLSNICTKLCHKSEPFNHLKTLKQCSSINFTDYRGSFNISSFSSWDPNIWETTTIAYRPGVKEGRMKKIPLKASFIFFSKIRKIRFPDRCWCCFVHFLPPLQMNLTPWCSNFCRHTSFFVSVYLTLPFHDYKVYFNIVQKKYTTHCGWWLFPRKTHCLEKRKKKQAGVFTHCE